MVTGTRRHPTLAPPYASASRASGATLARPGGASPGLKPGAYPNCGRAAPACRGQGAGGGAGSERRQARNRQAAPQGLATKRPGCDMQASSGSCCFRHTWRKAQQRRWVGHESAAAADVGIDGCEGVGSYLGLVPGVLRVWRAATGGRTEFLQWGCVQRPRRALQRQSGHLVSRPPFFSSPATSPPPTRACQGVEERALASRRLAHLRGVGGPCRGEGENGSARVGGAASGQARGWCANTSGR
jgi:hypothetical protein